MYQLNPKNMKRKTLLLMLLMVLFSSGAWAQTEYHSYTNINHTYGSSSSLSTYNSDRYPERLFDNSMDTKYCVVFTNNTWAGYLSVTFESNDLIIPSKYVIYTGDDTQSNPGRNPKSWHIDAKVNASDSWTTIHTVTNANLPTTNKTRVEYTLSGVNTAYKYFRFYINSVESGSIFQLQDFHFIATVQGEGFVLDQNLNEDLTCGGSTYNFYDSGGANGDYSSSESYTAIFNCNSDITITFTSFVVESYSSNYDYLTLYDGETQIAKLGGSNGSISSNITTATSYTATSGTLKAVWKSDSSQQRAGWNATITTGTCRYITEIRTPADWKFFCDAVNSGHDYSGETVTLMNDITTAVTTMAGTITGDAVGNAFKGTFDGQGHTLTLNISGGASSGWSFTAPFRCINAATIKNLKTAGTVTQTGGKGAAGIVGCSIGACTITNCDVNVTINSQTNGDGTHGGFISYIKSNSVTFNGCAFTGSITGSNTRYCGGFVGWNNGTATFNNCVFAPTAITFNADYSGDNSANFSRNGGTFNNCYYTQTCGSVVQGKLMHSITGASGITVANAGTATSYTPETSTIVGYGTGIKFNNILYAANNENVSLNLSASTSGIFYADNATITGNSNPYSLAMPNENVVIRLGQGFTITATANPVAGGSVTGGGTFAQGSSCTLTATANTGYSFANWTLNGVVVSTNASYTFTVSEDATYVANFQEWGVFITSTPVSTENLTPGTQVTLTASTNVPYSPGLDQYVFNTGNDGSMITPQSWESMIASGKDDVASSLFNMGFTFTYDNVEYTQFSANSNGNLRLGGTVISSGSYSTPLGSSNYTANAPKIIGIGKDLSTGSAGYVRTGLYGSEGSYVRVIEFKLNTGSSTSGTTYVMFQVQLFQANNEVRIVYSSDYSNAPSSYQIGIGNADHNKFWHVNPSAHSASYSTTYNTTTYSVYPGGGRYYSFTPSTPIYNWTCNAGTAGTANDNVYTVTPTENSSYTVSTTINGQTYTSNTITVTLGTMKYIFTNNGGGGDNNWNTSTNWSPVGLPTTDDNVEIRADVTIPSGCLAKADTISFLTNPSTGGAYGSITIEDGGQLWHSNSGVNLTIERDIPAYHEENEDTNLGYKIISFPVGNLTPHSTDVTGLLTSSHYDFYTFDYTNQDDRYLEWVRVIGNYDSDEMDPHKGYLYASQDSTTISVTGEVAPSAANDSTPFIVVTGDEPFNGWYMVGNPFVCNAYLTANGGNLDFYEIEDYTQSGYAEFVLNDNTVAIPPMGGVMVRVHDDDVLVYSRTAPTNSKGGILNVDVNKVLSSKDGSAAETIDRARLRFGEGRNLEKLQLNPRHTKLYIPEGAKDYSVVYTEGAGSMPVNFKAENNGHYTLSFSTEDVNFNYLHLIDNMTGADVDLLAGASTGSATYTFNAKTTDYESRFKLVFAASDVDGSSTSSDTFAFYSNGVWVVNNEGDATLQVVDINGRILSSERISGATTKSINAASGIYMLRLINGDNVRVQKIVVR